MSRASSKQPDAKITDVPNRDSQQITDLIQQLERDLEKTRKNVRKLPQPERGFWPNPSS